MTTSYLNSVIGKPLFDPRLLVWDSFRTHNSEATKKILKQLKLDVPMVPGGATKISQT